MYIEQVYQYIWLWSSFGLCLLMFLKYVNSPRCTLLNKQTISSTATIVYCLAFSFWIGLRPMDQGSWADSFNYANSYYLAMGTKGITDELVVDTGSEWLWDFIMRLFVVAKSPVEYWFLLIAFCYTGFMYLAIRRMMPCNQWIALLFCVSSFSFLTFSYNGLRNGMACSVMLFALSYFMEFNKKGLIWGLFWSFLALGIHRSTFLPLVCGLIAYFTRMDFKWAFAFWILSIILSLVAGNAIQNFFANLGFDDRMKSYAGTAVEDRKDLQGAFAHTGFRWDFLLYSAMPILLGYYIVYKKKIRDRAYDFLIVTYILANSFWVMVIKAAFSNRFAYLSWFMYPIVFAYPLLKVKIWKDQDRKTVQILMLFVLFTVFLNIIYW